MSNLHKGGLPYLAGGSYRQPPLSNPPYCTCTSLAKCISIRLLGRLFRNDLVLSAFVLGQSPPAPLSPLTHPAPRSGRPSTIHAHTQPLPVVRQTSPVCGYLSRCTNDTNDDTDLKSHYRPQASLVLPRRTSCVHRETLLVFPKSPIRDPVLHGDDGVGGW